MLFRSHCFFGLGAECSGSSGGSRQHPAEANDLLCRRNKFNCTEVELYPSVDANLPDFQY